jgi:hypothetical protein
LEQIIRISRGAVCLAGAPSIARPANHNTITK